MQTEVSAAWWVRRKLRGRVQFAYINLADGEIKFFFCYVQKQKGAVHKLLNAV